MSKIIKQYLNSKILSVLFLGFSSGLPLALSGATLQAWFTVEKLDLMLIGSLSLVGLPYTWKFLWAPLFDRFQLPFLGHRRGWIIILQAAIASVLFTMSTCSPTHDLSRLITLAVILAFLSATQDVVINAYQTEVLLPRERGLGGAVSIGGYRIAMLVSGAAAFMMADHWGWRIVYLTMGGCMLLCILFTLLAPRLSDPKEYPKSNVQAFYLPMKALFKKPGLIALLLFIVLYKLGDVFTLSFSSVFMIRHLHFTLTEIGIMNKMLALWAAITGGLLGGFCLTRWRLYVALLRFGILQAFSNLGFMLLAIIGKNFIVAMTVIGFEYFCGGLATAAFVALLMGLCDKEYAATQYACLTALAGLAIVLIGPLAAMVLKHIGWVQFYGWGFLLGFPALVILYSQRNNPIFSVSRDV